MLLQLLDDVDDHSWADGDGLSEANSGDVMRPRPSAAAAAECSPAPPPPPPLLLLLLLLLKPESGVDRASGSTEAFTAVDHCCRRCGDSDDVDDADDADDESTALTDSGDPMVKSAEEDDEDEYEMPRWVVLTPTTPLLVDATLFDGVGDGEVVAASSCMAFRYLQSNHKSFQFQIPFCLSYSNASIQSNSNWIQTNQNVNLHIIIIIIIIINNNNNNNNSSSSSSSSSSINSADALQSNNYNNSNNSRRR